MTTAHSKRPVVIVEDDARVVRLSELRKLYAEAGDLRVLGKALGISASTLSRALRLDTAEHVASEEERIARVHELLELEATR